MVRNLAIGNKGPKRNLFLFVSQLQNTDFFFFMATLNMLWTRKEKTGVPLQAGTYQTYLSVPYCTDLSASSLRSLNRQGLSWPLSDIACRAPEQNAGQEVLRATGFHDSMSGKVPWGV